MSAPPTVSPAVFEGSGPIAFRHASIIATLSRTKKSQGALPTASRRYEVGKRFLDISLALLLLTPALLLMVSTALAVVVSSGRPVLFRQRRIGRYGRPFTMWKFRTMRRGGKRILCEHLRQNPEARAEWQASHKLRHDPRITPLGKLLRETSLDEIPQILNILLGHMSFVGPRPIVTKERARYAERLPYYLAAKPGVTGLWQISGRCNVSYESRVILDETYVRHWTLGGDFWILLQTPRAVFCKEGAC